MGRTRAGSIRMSIARCARLLRCSSASASLVPNPSAEVIDLARLPVLSQKPIAANHITDVSEVANYIEIAHLDVSFAPSLYFSNLACKCC